MQGPNTAEFEAWINVNYWYNTENLYSEKYQALQKLRDNNYKEKEAWL